MTGVFPLPEFNNPGPDLINVISPSVTRVRIPVPAPAKSDNNQLQPELETAFTSLYSIIIYRFPSRGISPNSFETKNRICSVHTWLFRNGATGKK